MVMHGTTYTLRRILDSSDFRTTLICSCSPTVEYYSIDEFFFTLDAADAATLQRRAVELRDHIRRDIGAFLTRVWRDGALMGATPEDAFFVKCDEETNPPDVIDAGQVVAIVGLAPVKPAEFVVFQVMQSASGAQVSPVSAGG